MIYKGFLNSEIGTVCVEDNGAAVTAVYLCKNIQESEKSLLTEKAIKQLEEYFCGSRRKFDLPIEMHGTDFQLKVWKTLCDIPYGETRSYKDIAQNIGNPKAVRAVGGANNKNKLMIIVPCHRVIGVNGNLIGYAGGIDIKEKLLKIEKQGQR